MDDRRDMGINIYQRMNGLNIASGDDGAIDVLW